MGKKLEATFSPEAENQAAIFDRLRFKGARRRRRSSTLRCRYDLVWIQKRILRGVETFEWRIEIRDCDGPSLGLNGA